MDGRAQDLARNVFIDNPNRAAALQAYACFGDTIQNER